MFNYNDKINPGDVIAVGDIHGMAQLYFRFLDWVKDTGARVILLGDLIDRGGQDEAVLLRTRQLLENPDLLGLETFTVLKGNHEQMFINAVDGWGLSDWVHNGGDYENFELLAEHAGWLRQLPYYVTVGDTMFTHAGTPPGRNPQDWMATEYLRETFLWQREPFLSTGPQFEQWTPHLKKIVFGHTPKNSLPYRIPNGICIDTAAYHTRVLTAYNNTQETIMQFDLIGE